MKQVLVTGATGFIGSHVASELQMAGYTVRALVRPAPADTQTRRNPLDPAYEVCIGDLRDPASLRRALQGCDALAHVAADYRLWAPDQWAIYDTNLIGTRNLLVAALRQGVQRVVYTSSVAACGIPADGSPGERGNAARPTSSGRRV